MIITEKYTVTTNHEKSVKVPGKGIEQAKKIMLSEPQEQVLVGSVASGRTGMG